MQWRFVIQAVTAAVFLTVSSASAAVPGVGLSCLSQSIKSPTDDLFIWFYLKVVNNGSTAVDLNRIRIKYWFTYEQRNENSIIQHPKLTYPDVEFSPVEDREGVDTVAEITFSSSTESISPESGTTRFVMKFLDSGWGIHQDETNDYSYRAENPMTLAPNEKITVYYDGVLVYGTEPPLLPCFDGVQNNSETGVDCGGSCQPCTDDVLRSAVYPENWTPGWQTVRPEDGAVLFLQDYSYAGYKNGEEALPSDPVTVTVTAPNDGSVDVKDQIQAALDSAAAAEGGVVYLPAGLYRLDGELNIGSSNVVLRGAGEEQTQLFFTDAVDAVTVGGSSLGLIDNADWKITADGDVFETSVEVQNAAGLSPGDDIHIAWNITADFKAEHNSSDYWFHIPLNTQRTFFRRTITAVDGNRVYFKVPLRYPVKALRDSAVVRKATSYVSGSGVEHLGISTALGSAEENWSSGVDQTTAIRIRQCRDCWVQHVRSFAQLGHDYHLRSHGIYIYESFRVTVDNCVLEHAENLGSGGNGYLFQISTTNEALIKDSIGRYGRHNFAINWDFGATGNVFLRVESSEARICNTVDDQIDDTCYEGDSNIHHALATANLFDSSTFNDGLAVGNRQTASIGAGMTGTQNVFWNLSGSGMIRSYNFGMGYVIGTTPELQVETNMTLTGYPYPDYYEDTGPEDFTEYLGFATQLEPASLYEDQLSKRLGSAP
ncbi:MAG: glycosyl hydrolase family 28-related protein [Candidatus Electrothrix sp. YB6]